MVDFHILNLTRGNLFPLNEDWNNLERLAPSFDLLRKTRGACIIICINNDQIIKKIETNCFATIQKILFLYQKLTRMKNSIKKPHLLLLVFMFLSWNTWNTSIKVINAAEIVPTKEWALLKEGETIPAGLHIKMDLSTGEKWVKLPDVDNDLKEEVVSIVGEEGTFSAEVNSDGSIALVRNIDGTPKHEEQKEEITENASGGKKEPQYDFMMMHRTLSKLGEDEIIRMGLPELPPENASLEIKQEFETHMVEIWTTRQKALKELEVADLPKILKKRIYAIQTYIQDGVISYAGLTKDGTNEEEEVIDNSIEFVLDDLEYQLTDLDNARDFHTLEGWPLLVSLLSDDAHLKALEHIQDNFANETEIDQAIISAFSQRRYKQKIQTASAWVIGTAVKNVHEFLPWALEDVSRLGFVSSTNKTPSGRINVLDLLLSQFQNTLISDPEHENHEEIIQNKKSGLILQQKIIYALGSLLRFNPPAQEYFLSVNGPKILEEMLKALLYAPNPSEKDLSLATKILSLGSDIVVEAREATDHSQPVLDAFLSYSWCHSAPTLLNIYSQKKNISSQERMLNVMDTIALSCKDSWEEKTESVVRKIMNDLTESDIEKEWKDEILQLGEQVMLNMKQ